MGRGEGDYTLHIYTQGMSVHLQARMLPQGVHPFLVLPPWSPMETKDLMASIMARRGTKDVREASNMCKGGASQWVKLHARHRTPPNTQHLSHACIYKHMHMYITNI